MLINLSSSREVDTSCSLRVIVIPFGSLEYHGGILPYNTDTVIASKISEYCLRNRLFEKNNCFYIVPTIPLGYSHEWLIHPGTISIDPITYSKLVYSVVESHEFNLKPHGYVLINAHGGNTNILESICRDLYFKYNKPFILIDLWKIAGSLGLKYCHACVFESKLYSFLTGLESSGINELFCREDYLRGQYLEYKPGYCGDQGINVEMYLNIVCNSISKAIDLILGFHK